MIIHHVRRTISFFLLGAASGAVAGLAAFVLLESLDRVTEWRIENSWLVWLLPVGGLVVGAAYHWLGGRGRGGTALAVSEAHAYTTGSPARMAPLVFVGTVVGHLVGACIGREGVAVQMSSSITDAGARLFRLDHDHRAMLARAALAGGFGAVFGVPLAGLVFATEVARRRTVRAVAASVPAAFVGDAVVRALGRSHDYLPHISVPFDVGAAVGLIVGGLIIGLVARLFAAVVPAAKALTAQHVPWPWLRPALGGAVTLALVGMVGRDYLGLSIPLLNHALAGDHINSWQPALKLLFLIVALASGFVGGEVTPLFVTGATLGSVLAGPLAVAPTTMASLGLAALFGAAAHVPLTCAVMAAELFGASALVPALVVCLCARAVAGRTSIYEHDLSEAAMREWAPTSGGPQTNPA